MKYFIAHLTKRLPSLTGMALVFLFFTGCKTTPLEISVFKADVTPPIGSPVAYALARSIQDSLSARGVVIFSDEDPIVLCAVDWIGIANEGMERWKQVLAEAAHTTEDRVSIHALHQHDGVECDMGTETLLQDHGLGGKRYDNAFAEKAIQRVAQAIRKSMQNKKAVTHLGFGQAKVDSVASNRRILGPDGKVAITRWSKTTDSAAIAAPEGLIDPWLKSVSFWNGDQPITVMTYYATHPQSYYGQGDVTCEFVGIARNDREKDESLPHIHFNGASGNITAGKYNDGSVARRPILAKRMERAMKEAWENTVKTPITSKELVWKKLDVTLPLGEHVLKGDHKAQLSDTSVDENGKLTAAKHYVWLNRTTSGKKVTLSSLRMGKVWLLHLPGEAFIEYQLAAQKLRPGEEVCTAAYEEYGMGYIGTEIAFSQGGYETSERATRVSAEVEKVMMEAIEVLLR